MASPPQCPTIPEHLPSSTHLLHSPQPLLQESASLNYVADNGCILHNPDHSLSVLADCNIDSLMDKDMQVVHDDESYQPESIHGAEPIKGMTFKSLEEAEQFYYVYARVQGFNVRIRNSSYFSRSKMVRYRRYVCSCEGYCLGKESRANAKKEKKTLTIRKGCPVNFTVSRKSTTSLWAVINVENVHNHVLVSPRSIKNLRNLKAMPPIAKNLVEKFSEVGLPTGKVADILSDEPVVNISSRDCWNHMRNLRTRNLDAGDAESVFQYCKMKQAQDPNFYYSIMPDKESRMINFFWVDSRARLYYERFGDVVVFDTTYKTNKYGMPFGLFVGGNHHFQSILFGCALLQDESEESFVWLFETWLDAMQGKTPISILTDQDQAIGNAIKRVFPNTTHRLCLWHIMKKFPEKYGNLYKKKSPFKKDMKKCLHQSITVEDFEKDAADDIPVPLARETDKSSIVRTMHFHRQMNLLLPYVHDSVEAYQVITEALSKVYEVVSQLKDLNTQVDKVETGQSKTETANQPLGDPHVSKTKGRSKNSQNESRNGRFMGGFEIGMNLTSKKKRKCRTCHEMGHNSSTCKKV